MKPMWRERPIGSASASPVLAGSAKAVRAGLASRRDFLKATGVAMMASLLPGPALPAQATPAPAPQRPNVILILTDDQGYGDLSCHGNPVLKTPNMDRLHDQSIRLTDFHVAPMCSPTRGS